MKQQIKQLINRVVLIVLLFSQSANSFSQSKMELDSLCNSAISKINLARSVNRGLNYNHIQWAEFNYEAIRIYIECDMKDSAYAAFELLTMTAAQRKELFIHGPQLVFVSFPTGTKNKLIKICESACTLFEKGKVPFPYTKDSLLLLNVYDNMAAKCHLFGEYKLALSYIQKAIDISLCVENKHFRIPNNYVQFPIERGKLTSNDEDYTKRRVFEKYYLKLLESEKKAQQIDSLSQDLRIKQLLIGKEKLESNKRKVELKLLSKEKEIQNLQLSQKDAELIEEELFTLENLKKADSLRIITKIKERETIHERNLKNIYFGAFAIVISFSFIVFKQKSKLTKEKKRSDELLLNILPSDVAEELKLKGECEAKQFDHVTVILADFVNFTDSSEKMTPKELVNEINLCFTAFDEILERNGLEKIKSIGDAYMAVCGLPNADGQHAIRTVRAAIDIIQFMNNHKVNMTVKNGLGEVRIGINTGSVVAGIVGVKKFAYDIWGDTVNIAARMEQSGQPGKINISGSTFELVKENFKCIHRGKIEAKNKGEIDMYFVEKTI